MDKSGDDQTGDRLNALFDNSAPTRRGALALGGGAVLAAGMGTLLGVTPASADFYPGKGNQSDWRFCTKCFSMIYSNRFNVADREKFGQAFPSNLTYLGRCPADDQTHNPQGFVFSLHFDSARVQPGAGRDSQYDWAFCGQCWCLFWNGDAKNKGRCQAGGGHTPVSFNFGLPHDSSANPGQSDWRSCGNCFALFYDDPKNTNKGKCPAKAGPGGGHVRVGNSFNYQPAYRLDGVQDKIMAAFNLWILRHKIPDASIVVMQNGKQFGWGWGARQSSTVVPIASLSKAITAMAVTNLVDAGKFAYTDKALDLLKKSKTFANVTPADPRANNIQVAHLLRHISGFPHGPGNDPVAPPEPAGIPNTAAADEAFVKWQLAKNLDRAPGTGTYNYNNVNYALLGLIIKQVSGQTYEAYCQQTVLNPHPYSDVRTGAGTQLMGAFGGWEMSVEQYADFIWRHFRQMSSGANAFMNASVTTQYGLGVQLKSISSSPTGRNVWHTGNWPGGSPPYPPTTPPAFSSYFALWDNELLVVTSHDRQLADATFNDLDTSLRTAAAK